MRSDKGRLYVALYARGSQPTMPDKEDTYHWAFLLGPKEEKEGGQGMRYHVTNQMNGKWVFEERSVSLKATNMLLGRVIIGKVVDSEGLRSVIYSVQVKNDDPACNCVIWVKDALAKLAGGKSIGTSQLNWQTVRDTAMSHVEEKKTQHRFDGKAPEGRFNTSNAPTFDLLMGKEVIA